MKVLYLCLQGCVTQSEHRHEHMDWEWRLATRGLSVGVRCDSPPINAILRQASLLGVGMLRLPKLATRIDIRGLGLGAEPASCPRSHMVYQLLSLRLPN